MLKAKEILKFITEAMAFKINSNVQLTAGLLIFKLSVLIFKQVLFHLAALYTYEHKAFYESLKSHLKIFLQLKLPQHANL